MPIKSKENDRINDYIKENYELSYLDLSKKLELSVDAIRKRMRRMKLPHKIIPVDSMTMIDLLKQRGLTEKEIKSRYDIDYDEAYKKVLEIDNYSVYEQRNEYNERILALIRNPEKKIKIKEKDWSYAFQEEGQPYMWVQFPEKSSSSIRIVNISDVHYGHTSCDVETLKKDIEYIAHHKHVYAIIGGDLIENASKLSIAGGVYEQSKMPNEQISSICEVLAPIAHKILFYVSGNHEWRVYNHMGIDIGRIIADRLKIPFFNEPAYVDLLWEQRRWTIYAQHGKSNSQTKGGKLNAAAKPASWLGFTNFIMMSHVHDKLSNDIPIIVRDTKNFRLIHKKQYIVVMGAYLRYFNNYGSRSGYPPTSRGRTALKIYKNGDYHLSE